jgi:uncharacterized repeat protein (TIGR01451 family)
MNCAPRLRALGNGLAMLQRCGLRYGFLALLLVLPLRVLAVDLQLTSLTDAGYDPVPAGATVIYHVSVANGAQDNADNTVTIFDLPVGTTLAASAPAACSVTGIAATGVTRVSCTNPRLNANNPVAHEFELPVSTASSQPVVITLHAAIGYASAAPDVNTPIANLAGDDGFYAADTNTGNNRLAQTTTLQSASDLVLVKTASPDPVIGGGEITYTLRVRNNGPSVAAGFGVNDILPAGVVLVAGSQSGAGWTFSGANGAHAGSLAVGAEVSYSFRARVNVGTGNVINGASITAGSTPDPLPDNDSATVTTQVIAGADMRITKGVNPAPASAGQDVTFTLTPRNEGPSAASGVTVRDELPEGFVVRGITPPANWNCSTDTTGPRPVVSCTRSGTMNAGTQAAISIVAAVPSTGPNSDGTVTNSAEVAATTADPNLANNTGSVSFTVLPDGADLEMHKSKAPALVPTYAGGNRLDSLMTSTLGVRNLGPRSVTGQLQVVDTLAVGEEWVDSSGNTLAANTPVSVGSWTCEVDRLWDGATAQRITCTLTSGYPVAANTYAPTLTLHTLARGAGTLTNTACTGGSGGSLPPLTSGDINRDPVSGNDCTGSSSRVTAERGDLAISKTTSSPVGKVVGIGDAAVEYTLTVTNAGADGTAGVVVNDPIPGFVAGVTTVEAISTPAGWSCGSQTSTWICRSGATVLAAGDTASIVFRVRRGLYDSRNESAGSCAGVSMPAGRFCNIAGVGIDASVPGSIGETNFANNEASDWVEIHPVANMATTQKSISSGTPGRAGVETTYTIQYQNQGPSPVSDVFFRDTFTLPANDAGFVLISAVRTPGSTACAVQTPLAPGIIAAAAAGGMSYSNTSGSDATLTLVCPRLAVMANGNTQSMLVRIRPNVDAGNTGRTFTNIADFRFDVDQDGIPDALAQGTLPGGQGYNYNADTTDDTRSASLPFSAGAVDLIVNKADQGFAGAVDPLGYDSRPGNEMNNRIHYRIAVTNSGPSLATATTITDTIAPPRADVTVHFIGTRTGTAAAMTGTLVPANDPASPCALAAGSSNPTTGAPLALICTMPGAGTIPLQGGVIASGQTSYLYLVYEYGNSPEANGDTLMNAVAVASSETETNTANNAASESTTIRIRADLALSKTAMTTEPDSDPAMALPATASAVNLLQPFWYVLEVENLGPGHSLSRDRSGTNPLNGDGAIVSDTLPVGLEVIGGAAAIRWQKIGTTSDPGVVPAGSGSCSLSGVAVSCHMGDLAFGGRTRILIPVRWTSWPGAGTVSNTATAASEQLDPVPGNNSATHNLQVRKASLAGLVFEDRDRTAANGGIHQGAEPGISGVTLRLSGTDAYGNVLGGGTGYIEVGTGADGTYLFDNLAPAGVAGYTLAQIQPATHVNGPVNPPTSGGDAPSAGGTFETVNPVRTADSVYSGISLPANTAAVRYNFPEVRRPSLSGFIYVDANYNDVRDAGTDGAIAGATIELLDAVTGDLVATAQTNASGFYTFNNLDPLSVHTLREVLPGGSYRNRPTAVNPGTIGGAACVTGCSAGSGQSGDAASTDRISNIDLSAGLDGADFNFGEEAITAISGHVYVDRNGNGGFDAADAGSVNSAANGGIAGVEIILYDGGGTELARTTTDANGAYLFDELSVGRPYRIVETQPPGYANGSENASNEITIAALAAGGAADADFGERLGALAGVVFEDYSAGIANNNNGVQDAGEQGIANVTLSLTGLDINGNTVSRTLTSAAGGGYQFADLLAGTYTITETQPPAYLDGKHSAGNAATPGSNAVANVISGIGLAAGESASGYLYGELAAAPINGSVYLDRNDDGIFDAGDAGIPGVTIVIEEETTPGTWTVVHTRQTGADGGYSYPDAAVGRNYRITETQPTGLAEGRQNGSASITPNVVTLTSLPPGGVLDNHFGELAASITGSVWLDANNNGARDPGEDGIAGVSITVPAGTRDAFGNIIAPVLTDSAGSYRFGDLLAGTYMVTEQAVQPSVMVGGNPVTTLNGITVAGRIGGAAVGSATAVTVVPSAVTAIALTAGAHSSGNDFGEILPVSVSGLVFIDVNNDGLQSGAAETGIAGVSIELSGVDDTAATVSVSVTSDADGRFSFTGLRPGIYTLTEPAQPAGTANGITTAGTVDGLPSAATVTPVTTLPSRISGIDLRHPGSVSADNLFAEVPRNSGITGRVWLDADNDGVVDPGENGIAGVTVELRGIAIDNTTIELSMITDADGHYRFTNLPPGTYTVTEPTQPPGTLDGRTVTSTPGATASAPGTAPSRIATLQVDVGEISADNNFGEIPAGSIAGHVYNDSNDDGLKQADEGGYALIDLVLTGIDDLGNGVHVTVSTDAQGRYVFDGLRPGTYAVTEPDQPEETLNGATSAGHIGGTVAGVATDRGTVPSAIANIVLPVGAASIDNNFGEIGDSPDMLVTKSSTTPKFTVNNVATYTIRVRNGGQKASQGEYVVRDRLPQGLTLVEAPAGEGWSCSGAAGEDRFECRSSRSVAAGAVSTADITVQTRVAAVAAEAGRVNNVVIIGGGGENAFRAPTPAERNAFEGDIGTLPLCEAGITRNACRVENEVQRAGSVGGTVWLDAGSDPAWLDGGDERLPGWTVELVDPASGGIAKSATTAADGSYRFDDVIPGEKWHIRFRDPASGIVWAWPVNQETAAGTGTRCDADAAITAGEASACRVGDAGTSDLQVVLKPGAHLPQQSLPVDPSGVVYDSTTRDPVPGSIVTLTPVGCAAYDPATSILNALAGGYRISGNAISMTVGSTGFYQFVFAPSAPARCEFRLTVTPPGDYRFASTLIPAEQGSLSPEGDAGSVHRVQPQLLPPTGAVGAETQYWLTLFAGSATADIIHNHIPLDAAQGTALVIVKVGDRRVAEIGDTVQYTITVRQTAGSPLHALDVVDTLPRGFTYIEGTARVDGQAIAEPAGRPGPRLGFELGSIQPGTQRVLSYRVRVGVGAQQGDGVNRAQAHGCSITGGCIDATSVRPVPGSIPSNLTQYRVRVSGGVFTAEACVLGKIFVDCNNNHVQDPEELGIPGVRLYFSDGTWMVSDSEGKYSYCGLTPQSHTLKVDAATLPKGSRLTTSSNRNLGDADSLLLDLKNGELHRADFIEGSCSNPVLEQVKARRTQGEIRAPEAETGQPALRFESKPRLAPRQATDSANQRPIVRPRGSPPAAGAAKEVQP